MPIKGQDSRAVDNHDSRRRIRLDAKAAACLFMSTPQGKRNGLAERAVLWRPQPVRAIPAVSVEFVNHEHAVSAI